MVLSSLVRSLAGAGKRAQRERGREIIRIPGEAEIKEIFMPGPEEEIFAPPAPSYPVHPKKEVVVKVKPRSRPDRPQTDQPQPRQAPARKKIDPFPKEVSGDLEDLLFGKKIPLAIVASQVFAPPRSKRPFRPGS